MTPKEMLQDFYDYLLKEFPDIPKLQILNDLFLYLSTKNNPERAKDIHYLRMALLFGKNYPFDCNIVKYTDIEIFMNDLNLSQGEKDELILRYL